MIKIDIFSGFLGAGKTTLIKKLLNEAYKNEKLVLIENEFGEIGIDGGFLKEAGVEINEMNSGCICCSLVGDFSEALKKVIKDFSPDRILIEPSGVGKLSDVIKAIENIDNNEISLNGLAAVVDAKKCKMYTKNFGEFYNDQIKSAGCIVLSRTKDLGEEKTEEAVALIRKINPDAAIVTTDWDELDGEKILKAVEGTNTLSAELDDLKAEEVCPECGHHHHNHECECGHHHEHKNEHDTHCGCGHHDHHDHNDHHHHDCECGHHHEHKNEHHDHCDCEQHEHHTHDCGCGHHDHHHADEVFSSWGTETSAKFSKEQITNALDLLENSDEYGYILRAKGMVADSNGGWIYFDYTPGEIDVREGSPDIIGRLCVIGSDLNTDAISQLFSIK